MSPADFGALMRGNGNDMFGGNGAWWIIILLLFGWGRNGMFGNGGGATDGYILTSDFANIERKLDGINNGICDSTFALNNTINSNFRTLDGAICNIGYQILQNANALQTQIAQCCCETQQNIERSANSISRQISESGNEIEKMNMQNRFDAQAFNCNTLQAIDKLGDRIIDYMTTKETQTLRDENQALRLAASQASQNQYLVNTLRPLPVPAYSACNPWAGCGC